MPTSLLEALSQGRILLGDGAMGTQLQLEGLTPGTSGELWNVEHPDRIEAIHARYRDAGSDLVLTNTFQGSRLTLARHGLGDRAAELNRAAAEIARRTMGPDRWVFGDIGPFGGMLAPLGEATSDDVHAAFLEQARALLEGGVDAIIVETMTSLEELEIAIRAAREAGATVVAASLAYDHTAVGGVPRTMMGVSPDHAIETLDECGVDIVGCNCGTELTLGDHAAIVRLYRELTELPIMVQPNAGRPEMTSCGIVYHENPEKMAANILQLVEAGANILGGCCGTTPRHIELFRQQIDHHMAADSPPGGKP